MNNISAYHCYILKSSKDGRYYYGSTQNLEERLAKHNNKLVRSTKHRVPFVIHYTETFATRSEAFQREHFFKSVEGYQFLKKNNII